MCDRGHQSTLPLIEIILITVRRSNNSTNLAAVNCLQRVPIVFIIVFPRVRLVRTRWIFTLLFNVYVNREIYTSVVLLILYNALPYLSTAK